MDKLIMYFIGVFFLLGGIDYVLGNRFKLGEKFEEGIKTMGPLAIGMVGIYSLSPIISKIVAIKIVPICRRLSLDPSIIPAMFLATDMGGYKMSCQLALNKQMAAFSGVIITSTVGTIISFTIPVALGMISKDDRKYSSKGVMIGVISIPIGCFMAGIYQGIKSQILLWNLMPIFIFSMLLSIGLIKIPSILIRIFNGIGKIIIVLSIIGLVIQGVDVIFGFKIVKGLAPLSESMLIVGKIAFVLAGAYPMLTFINIIFKERFNKIGKSIGINSASVAGILGNLASNLLTFGTYEKMNPKGKVVSTAFSVSGAFVFGGQFGFISGVEPSMLISFIIVKFISGIISVLLALWIYEWESKKYNTRKFGEVKA